MDSTSRKIVELAAAYTSHTRRAETTISRLAVGSWDAISRLRNGHDITTRRAETLLSWFSTNWPTDLEWPADIPRPQSKEDAA